MTVKEDYDEVIKSYSKRLAEIELEKWEDNLKFESAQYNIDEGYIEKCRSRIDSLEKYIKTFSKMIDIKNKGDVNE
jgi:hypothetical protein